MATQHFDPPDVHGGCTVHLTQHRDGWSVTVSRACRPAAFEAHHRNAADALAMAKQIAAAEAADLIVLTLDGRGMGYEFVPAARVASYVLPITRD